MSGLKYIASSVAFIVAGFMVFHGVDGWKLMLLAGIVVAFA